MGHWYIIEGNARLDPCVVALLIGDKLAGDNDLGVAGT